MKPRAIGIVSGGGGPLGASSFLSLLIEECQHQYHCNRSYEYPCINFFSYPYSETMLTDVSQMIPSRELSYCIQQLKLLGMEIVVVPCFTMCSYLTFRSYGIELIEIGAIVKDYLERNKIDNPLVLCSNRTCQSGYCENHFPCRYPNEILQKELTIFIEEALSGKKIDLDPFLQKLPDTSIVCAMGTLCAQMKGTRDTRLINPSKILAKYVVKRSFEGNLGDLHLGWTELEKELAFAKH